MNSNIVDLELIWHHETERAVLVASVEETEPVWLPKSQIDIDADEPKIRGFSQDQALVLCMKPAFGG